MHIHSIITTNVAPDLGELAEVLGEVCIHLRYGWGYTFQSASHILEGVWEPSIVVDGHMNAHLHYNRHKHSPRFGRVEQSPEYVCKLCHYAMVEAV